MLPISAYLCVYNTHTPCARVCVCACVSVCICIYRYVYIGRAWMLPISAYECTDLSVCVYVCVCVCVCM